MISVELLQAESDEDDDEDAATPKQGGSPPKMFLRVDPPPEFAVRSASAPPLRDGASKDDANGLDAQQRKSFIGRVVSQPLYRPFAVRGSDDWLTEEEANMQYRLPVAARSTSAPVSFLTLFFMQTSLFCLLVPSCSHCF